MGFRREIHEMRILTDRPYFVLVTGLARTGTTLLTSILNGAENADLILEPHNGFLELGYWTTPDGTQLRWSMPDLVDHLKLKIDGRDVSGVKEVLEGIPPDIEGSSPLLVDYALPSTDLVIICRRNPVDTFASQKAVLKIDLEKFYFRTLRYRQWIKALKTPHVTIDYELLIRDALNHLNNRLKGYFSIEGPIVKRGMGGNGDQLARESEEIIQTTRRPGLTPEEIQSVKMFTADWLEL